MTANLIIEAGAGTGKTFCVTEGVHRICHSPRKTVGSEEQQAIWTEMQKDKFPGRIHMTSFTTDAAEQLAERCPTDTLGNSKVTSSSIYGMGYRFAKQCGHAASMDQWGHKYKNLVTEALGKSKWDLKDEAPGLWDAVHDLQGKVRLELRTSLTEEQVEHYAEHYGIELPERQVERATIALNAVLKAGLDKVWQYDFTDMVYIPVVKGLITKRYDTLVVDEFQDMGRAQQELCLMISRKQILIGDPHQAIYGWAGADNEAFERMQKWLGMTQRGVKLMTLNQSRRCAKSIVARANQLYPELQPLPNAPQGDVLEFRSKERFYEEWIPKFKENYSSVALNDRTTMVVCPTNAPLISMMFRLQEEGVKSFVHGKDITANMVEYVSKFNDISSLRSDLLDKLERLKGRKPSKTRDLQIDMNEAIFSMASKCADPATVERSIKNCFSDTPRPGWLKLTTVHKAKGLEADTVVFWEVNKCKNAYSTLPYQRVQDKNVEYVGITRAKTILAEVRVM